ncbi:MAG: arginase family protein, partial [Gammaproteobacteria bacterium]|nr:arginase family protein [Gammaproteobacteria bacterium]
MFRQGVFEKNNIALIGVPSSAGARQVGQEQAPQCLRAAGLVQRLISRGYSVMDLGDLNQVSYRRDTDNPKKQNLPLVLDVLGQVRESVKLAIANRAWPLILGGDCSITIGVIAAMIKHFPDLGLSYIDGDVDLNTPETTNTGIFDGMVLAHILGQGADELRQFGTRCPLLEEQQIALFGYSVQAGGIDPAEIDILRNTQMAKFPLEDIDADVQTAAIQALQELESKSDHILVHFDVDVVDYDDFPAVDVPHKPGLALAQAQEALGVFVGSRKSVGLVVTEFNAAHDAGGNLAETLLGTIE